jgi:hypothetical protein
MKAIDEVNLEIMRTVARSKLHLIADLDLDVRLRLNTLGSLSDHQLTTSSEAFISVRCYSAEAEELECAHVAERIFLNYVTLPIKAYG